MKDLEPFLDRVKYYKSIFPKFQDDVFLNWWNNKPEDWRKKNEHLPIAFLNKWRTRNFYSIDLRGKELRQDRVPGFKRGRKMYRTL